MLDVDPRAFHQALQAALAGLTMLGGVMGVLSGWRAAAAILTGQTPEAIDHAINLGIGYGFIVGTNLALPTAIISLLI